MTELLVYSVEFFDWFVGRLYAIVNFFFYPGSRVYWLFLIISLLFAVVSYQRYINVNGAFSLRDFLRFVAPKRIYLHPSAIVDYKLFIVNRFIRPVTALTAFISTAAIGVYTGELLSSSFGTQWQGLEINVWTLFFFTLLYALSSDFITFLNHALHHKLSLLWPIHRLHHSAEVMMPLTVYRKHPVYGVIKFLIRAPLLGAVQGLTIFLFMGKVDPLTIIGINMFYALFLLAGSCLRHSHIWISFGPILNYVLISPAHHQIHHSARLEHRDCNFGEVFAVWDYLFGTLILPSEEIRKNLVFGIALNAPQPHPSLTRAYLEPLQSVFQVARQYIWLR